jgi:hypothetical protein
MLELGYDDQKISDFYKDKIIFWNIKLYSNSK